MPSVRYNAVRTWLWGGGEGQLLARPSLPRPPGFAATAASRSRRSESALGPKASLCAAFDRPSLALLDQNGDALSNVHRSLKHDLPRAEFCLLFSMMTLAMRLFLLFLRFSDRADDHRPIWPVENAPIIGPATGQGLRRASSHVPGHTKRVLWLFLNN